MLLLAITANLFVFQCYLRMFAFYYHKICKVWYFSTGFSPVGLFAFYRSCAIDNVLMLRLSMLIRRQHWAKQR